MSYPLEIDKMLVLSTAHLRPSTCNEWLANHKGVTRYEKGEYGWFVYCGDIDNFQREHVPPGEDSVPNELQLVMEFAAEQGCAWITFDRDAATIDGLVIYEW